MKQVFWATALLATTGFSSGAMAALDPTTLSFLISQVRAGCNADPIGCAARVKRANATIKASLPPGATVADIQAVNAQIGSISSSVASVVKQNAAAFQPVQLRALAAAVAVATTDVADGFIGIQSPGTVPGLSGQIAAANRVSGVINTVADNLEVTGVIDQVVLDEELGDDALDELGSQN